MTGRIEKKLIELNIDLPNPAAPVASYSPFILSNKLLFISGQGPFKDGKLITGKVGLNLTIEEGQDAAKSCGEMILAQAKLACGTLDKIKKCIKLGGFVNCIDSFTDQAMVIEGASRLMIDVFEEDGWHSRFAVGANSLPLGMAVEIEAIFEVSS
jgi:enamine deaminase RidA (YjgF/YER057c/UK114 family)